MAVSTARSPGGGLILAMLLPLAALPAADPTSSQPSSRVVSPEESIYQQALESYRSGNFPQAVAALEKGVQKFPNNAGLFSLLGWSQMRMSNLASARLAFESATRLNPRSADAATGLGYVSLRQKRSEDAAEHFVLATQLDPKSTEAWKGLGMARRNQEDRKAAQAALRQALVLSPSDAEAKSLLDQVEGPSGVLEEKRRQGPVPASVPVRMVSRAGRAKLEIKMGEKYRPLFIKGINLGTALPGKFPAEFPDEPALYRRWFDQMGELGANVVRLYTLHPPSLYRALKEHNEAKPAQKLWLVQGVWTELPQDDDYDSAAFMEGFRDEIFRVIDAVHGNLEVPARPGHAHGVYDVDLSEDLLAYLLGREWEPYSVVAYEKMRPGANRFEGTYMKAAGARPFEVWLASICELTAKHETERYRWQHPVGYVSWPTLDPLRHVTEATAAEETELRRKRGEKLSEPILEYDNDAVDIDAMHLSATDRFAAGFFASYHAYPYYPEFMLLDPEYSKAKDAQGPSNYFGYLKDLKSHHRDQPVIIAEFGVPSSRGIAHLQPQGQNHGGHNTVEQGEIDARLFRNIHDAGLAGGILFSWMDEWFKRNWLVMAYEVPADRNPLWLNALDAEQNYGLLAAWPGKPKAKIALDGGGSDWDNLGHIYIDDKGSSGPAKGGTSTRLQGLRATSDEAYLYLRLDLSGWKAKDWNGKQFWIGVDTYDVTLGDHRFPQVDVTSPIGMEFLIQLAGPKSRILVDRPYDLFTNRNRRPYHSVENRNADFIDIFVYCNRDRLGRDGTFYPPQGYSRSPLRRGSLDPASSDYDTLADWIESPDGGFIEARIAWGLLNVTDPSSLQVVHESAPRTGPVATRRTEGFRFHVLALQEKGKSLMVTDRFPRNTRPAAADFPVYRWPAWEEPTYHLEVKDSYGILKEALKAIPTYDASK
ncbi:MAG: tetratricopeptide repeat protein [Acidobacteria bacterium]|nr:tetratricopeptide repeat protein [Acidobacteriota bacterium]